MFGCAASSLLCAGLLQLRQMGAALHCGVWGWCLLPSRGTGSRLEEYSGCGSWALEHELSRRGVQA